MRFVRTEEANAAAGSLNAMTAGGSNRRRRENNKEKAHLAEFAPSFDGLVAEMVFLRGSVVLLAGSPGRVEKLPLLPFLTPCLPAADGAAFLAGSPGSVE